MMGMADQYSVGLPDMNLADILKYRADAQSDRLGYTFLHNGEDEKAALSFFDLDMKARAIAANIEELGFENKKILLSFPPGLEFIEAFFGCLYCGAIAVPVTPPRRNQHGDRIRRIIEDCGARLILTTSSSLDDLRSHLTQVAPSLRVQYLVTDLSADSAARAAEYWRPRPIDRAAIAFLQYTSGSTGNPKGVIVSHANLIHNERMVKAAFGHTDKTIFVGWLPTYHDMGLIGNILQPLYLGIHCILMAPAAFTQKPIRWLRAISKYKATTSGGPNFAYDLCVQKTTPDQRAELDLSSWRVAYNGSEPVRADTLERFSDAFAPCGFRRGSFYPCYGMAEATLFVTGGTPDAAPTICHVDAKALEDNEVRLCPGRAGDEVRALVSCGGSWDDTELRIVDPKTRRVREDGGVGEIWVRGGSVAHGYLNEHDLTRSTFGASLADDGNGTFLRTGDLGFLLKRELYVTGRLKDLIILKGRNHYPQDIERSVAESHEAFRGASGAAFAVDAGDEERLVIVQEIERHALRRVDVKALAGAIREAVARHHGAQVHAVALVRPHTLPKTTSDKIRRGACRSAYLRGELEVVEDQGAMPTSPVALSDADAATLAS
jgi:acyl-CoA synthetase (AMP-forming)/AMP-acid ligase II